MKSRVRDLIIEKFGGADRVNLKEVERQTGLTYATVSRWYRDHVDRADFPVLDTWCEYFQKPVGEILVYIPDKKAS